MASAISSSVQFGNSQNNSHYSTYLTRKKRSYEEETYEILTDNYRSNKRFITEIIAKQFSLLNLTKNENKRQQLQEIDPNTIEYKKNTFVINSPLSQPPIYLSLNNNSSSNNTSLTNQTDGFNKVREANRNSSFMDEEEDDEISEEDNKRERINNNSSGFFMNNNSSVSKNTNSSSLIEGGDNQDDVFFSSEDEKENIIKNIYASGIYNNNNNTKTTGPFYNNDNNNNSNDSHMMLSSSPSFNNGHFTDGLFMNNTIRDIHPSSTYSRSTTEETEPFTSTTMTNDNNKYSLQNIKERIENNEYNIYTKNSRDRLKITNITLESIPELGEENNNNKIL